MLNLYKRILQGKKTPDQQRSLELNRLKLYGLVVTEHNRLRVRNNIYRKAFNIGWVKQQLPLPPRPYRLIIVILAVLLVIASATTSYLLYQRYTVGIINEHRTRAMEAFSSEKYEEAIADFTKVLALKKMTRQFTLIAGLPILNRAACGSY